MQTRTKMFSFTLIALGIASLGLLQRPISERSPTESEPVSSSVLEKLNLPPQRKGPSVSVANSTNEPMPLSSEEIVSLQRLMGKFDRFAKLDSTPENFVAELKNEGLRPIASEQYNEETGRKIIVRSEEALQGTRYLHAQFFEDESGMSVMQHISFELRPGPDSMVSAVQMAQETFRISEAPATQTDNFIEWHRSGRTLWIKKLSDPKELSDDPFNARDASDLGVVVIALEIDPHAHDKTK